MIARVRRARRRASFYTSTGAPSGKSLANSASFGAACRGTARPDDAYATTWITISVYRRATHACSCRSPFAKGAARVRAPLLAPSPRDRRRPEARRCRDIVNIVACRRSSTTRDYSLRWPSAALAPRSSCDHANNNSSSTRQRGGSRVSARGLNR